MYNNNIYSAVARYQCGKLRELPGQQAGVARGQGERGAAGRPEQSVEITGS